MKTYIGGFSGGIDSQAACLWMRREHGDDAVVICNSDAGANEHPLTVEHVDWYSAHVHFVHRTNAEIQDMSRRQDGTVGGRPAEIITELGLQETDPLTFDLMAKLKKRFPSRKAQFCTEHLKLRPMLRFMRERFPAGDVVRFSGMRRSESSARAKLPRETHDDYFDCPVIHPLVDWSKEQCFEYVQDAGEKINPLYLLGFNRVGCAPCINSSKQDILNWAERFPEMIDKVREWEERVGRTFFPPMVPGLEINWIDEVVRWSKTTHGGKQFSLFVLQERPACESVYGLCE